MEPDSTLVAADNRAVDDIGGALLVLASDGQLAAGWHYAIGVKGLERLASAPELVGKYPFICFVFCRSR
jgi:hypothetical protein